MGLLESIVDPVTAALRNAPVDDEPVTEEEERAVAEAREWLKQNEGISLEQVVAELGFTREEVKNYRTHATAMAYPARYHRMVGDSGPVVLGSLEQ